MPKKRVCVTEIVGDGEYVTAQFQLPNGEWVIGEYKLVGWAQAPASERAWIERAINSPPQTIYGRSPAAKPGQAR